MQYLYLISVIVIFLYTPFLPGPFKAIAAPVELYADEQVAKLDRGLIVLPLSAGRVFLTWRLLPQDTPGAMFEIWRRGLSVPADEPVLVARTDQTSLIDKPVGGKGRFSFYLMTVDDSGRKVPSKSVNINLKEDASSALVFDIGQAYKQSKVTLGDLDGDGELEVIVIHANLPSIDPSPKIWRKSEDTLKVSAFQHTGEKMWSLDLGWGIEAGPAYSPLVVWDINADGRAEVILKTNEGDDPRNYSNDRLSVLNGETGALLMKTAWPPIDNLGGDYNSDSRNYIAIAHLDGKNPTIIVVRGLYRAQVIWAYDAKLNLIWKKYTGQDLGKYPSLQDQIMKYLRYDNTLERLWSAYSGKYLPPDQYRGSHILPIADIDLDGKEEILWGEFCIGQNGKTIWKITERMPYTGHPDVVFPADIIPSIEGLEVFYAREGWLGEEGNIGTLLVDKNGQTLWAQWGYTHVDGGWAASILPGSVGMQVFAFDLQKKGGNKAKGFGFVREGLKGYIWDSEGRLIGLPATDLVGSSPFDWDGDGIKEVCIKNGDIVKFGDETIAQLGDGVKWGADLFGDHRDEVIVAPADGRVYIYFNTVPLTGKARLTKLADRQYRNDLSRTAVPGINILNESGIIIRFGPGPE